MHLDASTFANLIKTSTYDGSKLDVWIFKLIVVHAPETLIDEVLGILKYADDLLFSLGRISEVACKPQKFVHILKKLSHDVTWTFISNGIEALANSGRFECINPLRLAIKAIPSIDQASVRRVTQSIFLECFGRGNGGLHQVTSMVHDPDFDSRTYMNLVYLTADSGVDDKAFKWLLDKADRQDLEAVRRAESFPTKPLEFQEAINKAWEAARTKGQRTTQRGAVSASKGMFKQSS